MLPLLGAGLMVGDSGSGSRASHTPSTNDPSPVVSSDPDSSARSGSDSSSMGHVSPSPVVSSDPDSSARSGADSSSMGHVSPSPVVSSDPSSSTRSGSDSSSVSHVSPSPVVSSDPDLAHDCAPKKMKRRPKS